MLPRDRLVRYIEFIILRWFSAVMLFFDHSRLISVYKDRLGSSTVSLTTIGPIQL